MDSYGDGNVYRGQVCKDPKIKTIEINRYNADVERLVEAARKVISWYWLEILRHAECDDETEIKEDMDKLKAYLEPFKKVK